MATGIPGPQEAEPETTALEIRLSARQAVRFGELMDLLAAVSTDGTGSTVAAGTLLLAVADPGSRVLVRKVAHQLRVQAGTA